MECALGLRIGEAVGGGDHHGILANNLCILRRLDSCARPTGEETIEGLLEHSKTKHKRFVNAVGLTRGAAAIPLSELLRDYWRLSGFRVMHIDSGGYREERPDYYVVRLSLVALSDSRESDRERLDLVGRLMSRSRSAEARRWADYVVYRGKQRLTADSLDKRYINLVGGPESCADISTVMAELSLAGFEDWLAVVPGPLLRATHGRGKGLTHMPIVPGSTYEIIHDCFAAAHRAANLSTPDPELDLQGFGAPLWGHHSLRRFADTVARETMATTGATEQDIDIIFGWLESYYSQKMQLHYQSRFSLS